MTKRAQRVVMEIAKFLSRLHDVRKKFSVIFFFKFEKPEKGYYEK